MGIAPDSLATFDFLCRRERSPYAVVGTVSEDRQLVLANMVKLYPQLEEQLERAMTKEADGGGDAKAQGKPM